MTEVRGLAATLYSSLPLFANLIGSATQATHVEPMLPNKIKFVTDVIPPTRAASGVFFKIPQLLISEQEVLHNAITQVLHTATIDTVVDVPTELARKFNKSSKGGYHFLNELIYRKGKLVFTSPVKVTLDLNSTPIVERNADHILVSSLEYSAQLCQCLIGILRMRDCDMEIVKKFLRTVRKHYDSSGPRPTIGFKGNEVWVICSDGFEAEVQFKSNDPKFQENLCCLLYDLYSPYTEVSDYLKFV